MKAYKLTTQEITTHNGYKLPAIGQWFYPADTTSKPVPCSDTVLHYYHDPRLAVIFNPIHANIGNPKLWEIEIDVETGSDGLKGWCRRQRLIHELPLPVFTSEQLIA